MLKLGQVDQSGAEALIVSYLTRDGKLRSLFKNKIKVHSYVAAHLFQNVWKKENYDIDKILSTPIPQLPQLESWVSLAKLIKSSDDWPAKRRYYFIAKQTCHSSNYDIKAPTFQINLLEKSEGAIDLSLSQCKEFLNLYHGILPEIREWHNDIQYFLGKNRILYNLFGEARRFTAPWGDQLFKAAYAFIPQSTVGCITHRAIANIDDKIELGDVPKEWRLTLLGNGHDSILFQFEDKYEYQVCKFVSNEMSMKLKSHRNEEFVMGVECSTGFNWGPKSEKNPEGLEEYKIAA